jgi:hypothetical protein
LVFGGLLIKGGCEVTTQDVWKRKYEQLCALIQDLHEEVEMKRTYEVENDEPMSAEYHTIYVSHDWDVCDSKEFAIQKWGDRWLEYRVVETK